MEFAIKNEQALDYRSLLNGLVDAGMLDQSQLKTAVQYRPTSDLEQHPVIAIASQNFENKAKPGTYLDELSLTHWLADIANLDVVHINPLKIKTATTTAVMSYPFAKRYQIICIAVDDAEIVIACAQPFVQEWVEQLAHISRRKIRRVLAKPSDILRFSLEFYSLANSVSGANANGGEKSTDLSNFEQLLELGKLGDPEANDTHVVNIVDWLLQYAFDQRASDIHIEPRREVARVRFRIDGVLHQVYEFPADIGAAVVSRLKVLGRMNVAEKRKPQDGRIKTKRQDDKEIELRLSTLPTAFGEKLVLRIFDPEVLLRSFADLGLAGAEAEQWQQMLRQPHGIVLVTGPTGSGKTTTLYSSLKRLASVEVNVSTVEDPIELVEESFNQTQVQHNIGLNFAAGLRTLMRQDPDIIMVGEIRDLETAQMAAQASLTGHLVLSTLHTNDAASGITRLLELGLPAYLLRSTILGIMAQRLVRTLCEHCKAPSSISDDDWLQLTQSAKLPKPEVVYKAEGCLECRNTGYLGRQGIYELIRVSPELQQLIQDDADLVSLHKQAAKDGMQFLRISGAQKIAAGVTTLEEVIRVAPNSHVL